MNIIIEFTNRNKNIKEISQGIKIYLKKCKDIHSFTLIGPSNLLYTVNDEKNITIIDEKDEEEAINKALSLSKEKNNVLICFSQINNVIKIASNVLEFKTKEKTLTTGIFFKTLNIQNPLMLVNVDKINSESFEDMNNSISFFNDYLNIKNKNKLKTYKLLDSKTILTNDLNMKLSKDSSYQGCISVSELLNPGCDFVVCESTYVAGFLEGFKLAFNAINDVKNSDFNNTFLTNIGKKLTANINEQVENTFDKKTRSNGTILLGFNYPIIFGRIDDNLNSILKIFETSLN